MLSAKEDGRWVSYVYANHENGRIGSRDFGGVELKNAWVVRQTDYCSSPSAAESRSDVSLLGLQTFLNLVKERLKGACGSVFPTIKRRLQRF